MPKGINSYLETKKDENQQKFYTFIEVWMGDISDDIYYFTSASEPIEVINAEGETKTYQPYGFNIGSYTDDGNNTKVNVDFININSKIIDGFSPKTYYPISYIHLLQEAIDGYGLLNKKIVIFNIDPDDDTNTALEFEDSAFNVYSGVINRIPQITGIFSIEAIHSSTLENKSIPVRNHSDKCPWRFNYSNDRWWIFHGNECPYAQDSTIRVIEWSGSNGQSEGINGGQTVEGANSGATCRLLEGFYTDYAANEGVWIVDQLVGTFINGEIVSGISTVGGGEVIFEQLIPRNKTTCNKLLSDGGGCAYETYNLKSRRFGGFDILE